MSRIESKTTSYFVPIMFQSRLDNLNQSNQESVICQCTNCSCYLLTEQTKCIKCGSNEVKLLSNEEIAALPTITILDKNGTASKLKRSSNSDEESQQSRRTHMRKSNSEKRVVTSAQTFGPPKNWFVFNPSNWKIVNKEMAVLDQGNYSDIEQIDVDQKDKVHPTIFLKDGREIGFVTTGPGNAFGWRDRLPSAGVKKFSPQVTVEILQRTIELNLYAAYKGDSSKLLSEFKNNEVSIVGHYLGGYGLNFEANPGSDSLLTFKESGIQLNEQFLPWSKLIDISIGGPGLFQTGGGWFGGGIGIKGALEGALFATAMNALTTKTHISTVIRIIFENAELNIHSHVITPEQLDIRVGPIRAFLTRGVSSTKENRTQGGRFCTTCGVKGKADDNFCGSCGAKF